MDKCSLPPRLTAIVVALVAVTIVQASAQPTTTSLSQEHPQSGDGNRIEARAANLRDSKGSLRCVLFNSAEGFPRDDDKAVASASAKVADRQASCVFANVAAGSYAIAVLHDENDNGKMDYNFLGMPREGYGFSNDPHVVFSAPSFKSARFAYSGGKLVVPIRLHYWGGRVFRTK
jgi:uncharacterized protein (DUF2141 family)